MQNQYQNKDNRISEKIQNKVNRQISPQYQEFTNPKYATYLSTLSLSALEKQLTKIRQKQKQFYKLNYQLKLLQKKSKLITNESKKYISIQNDGQDEEIAQFKAQIEGVNHDIKNIVEEGKIIKKQCTESKQHLKSLQDELERVKFQNKKITNRINDKKQKLMSKSKIIQEFKQCQLQNHDRIQNLRQQIKYLEQQSHLLQNQLHVLLEQKQAKQMNKQKLQKVVNELERQLIRQKDGERQTRIELSNAINVKHNLQEELISMRKQEKTLIEEYEEKLQEYHNITLLTKQSDMKILNLEDELFMVENDIKELNQQFISEGQLLKLEENQNIAINLEFDAITKQAVDVWSSICELIKIQEQQNRTLNINAPSLQYGENDSTNQIKFKALKIWKGIESIIKNDENY